MHKMDLFKVKKHGILGCLLYEKGDSENEHQNKHFTKFAQTFL